MGQEASQVFHKQGGGIGAVLLKGFHKAPLEYSYYGGILEERLPITRLLTRQAEGTILHPLDTLSGWPSVIGWDILGLGDGQPYARFEETIQSGNGTGIARCMSLTRKRQDRVDASGAYRK